MLLEPDSVDRFPRLRLCIQNNSEPNSRLWFLPQNDESKPQADYVASGADDIANLRALRVTGKPPFWMNIHFPKSIAAACRPDHAFCLDKVST